jgi:large subunit ribosomal protein L17
MKAKELRPYAERLITLAKRDDDRLHARRLVLRDIHDAVLVKKLFDTLGARFAARPGGYTRILRLGPRRGDGAEMAIVELIGSEYQPEKKKGEKDKKKEAAAEKAKDAKPAKAPKEGKAKGQEPAAKDKGKRRKGKEAAAE